MFTRVARQGCRLQEVGVLADVLAEGRRGRLLIPSVAEGRQEHKNFKVFLVASTSWVKGKSSVAAHRENSVDIRTALKDTNPLMCRNTLIDFLSRYLEPAFGTLPKREVDLLVLRMLESLEYIDADPPLYQLEKRLRVTRAKARNLLYDRELRRLDTVMLDERIRGALKRPLIQKQGNLFALEIENPLVADHLRAKVQRLGYATDGSFSPSIVKLTNDAMAAVVEEVLTDVERKRVRRALIKAGAPDDSLRGLLKSAFRQIGRKFAQESGEVLLEHVSEYLEPLIDVAVDGAADRLTRVFRKMFSREHSV